MKPKLETALRKADYGRLEGLVAEASLEDLSGSWSRLKDMEKLIIFKLMDAPKAMDFYEKIPFRDKYYLFCGFPLNTIAPVLENLEPSQCRHFVSLPRKFYDRMFRALVAESES